MSLILGENVHDEDSTLYVVETMWPSQRHPHWGRYNPSAFNDKRNPNTVPDAYGTCQGTFDRNNMDVSNVESRVGRRVNWEWPVGPIADYPTFTSLEAAANYGRRLKEYGEVASLYSTYGTKEGREKDYKDKPLGVRIVVERNLRRTDVVLGIKMID